MSELKRDQQEPLELELVPRVQHTPRQQTLGAFALAVGGGDAEGSEA